MTCIIGLETPDKVYLGCDSAMIQGWSISYTKQPKIFRLGEFLIGIAGFPRTAQLVKYQLSLKPQLNNQNDFEYLCTEFSKSVKQLLVDNDHIVNQDGDKIIPESSLLFGYRKHLYQMDCNFQITQTIDKFGAIGVGQDLALGAMMAFTFSDYMLLSPEFRIRKSLEISAKYNMGVAKPFKVMSI